MAGGLEASRTGGHILYSGEDLSHLARRRGPRIRQAPLEQTVGPIDSGAGEGAKNFERRIGRFQVVVHATPEQRLSRTPVADDERSGTRNWAVRVRCGPMVQPGRDIRIDTSPFEVALGPLGASSSDGRFGADRIWVTLPAGTDPALDAAFLAHGKGKILGPRATMLGTFLLSLADFLPAAEEEDLSHLDVALRAMLLAGFPPVGGRCATAPVRAKALLRARVDRVVHENIASARLDAARIAKLAATSRTTLYRLFEGRGGVAAHVQRLRLERVRAALYDPAQSSVPIAALAERSGFHCVASFNRSFRRAYGATPGEVRTAALALGSLPAACPRGGDSSSDSAFPPSASDLPQ